MRLVSIDRCTPGMQLAKPIYTDNGNLLLGVGAELTETFIHRLTSLNVTTLYIGGDKITEDLMVEDSIPMGQRIKATQTIEKIFTEIKLGIHKSKAMLSCEIVNQFKEVFRLLLQEIQRNKDLMRLLTHIQIKDHYLFTHSFNVTLYTVAIAIKMGFNQKQLLEIGVGGLLHDVGKLFLPKEILQKAGKLDAHEFELIKKHTEFGFDFLRKDPGISVVTAHCAYQHHEKLDGTGYPRRLKGNQIHLYAKIMAVADVFDALTTNRVYRPAMLPHEAMEIIWASSHTHFDIDVVTAFKHSIALYPIGVTVLLNTGETGVVVGYNRNIPQRPEVRVYKDSEGITLEEFFVRDLSEELTVMISECDAIL
ncbi:HD-GYP domain-containing protein [Paenibacillus sp. Leaf72]|uniref:HD-GYP domain-containing protein n=1 Tax=Paenibacillus sp. Leaf72 TaxID=1736234 RepID=UPI0006FF2A44|nr:HD-GYP domain-containing protein [Paenibacillus sp. Leaf72]KQN96909.1 hypothetical protein ASF12_22840 [Paenibacillus sp. Leaf72]